MHKTTDESWDPLRLAILVLKALFLKQKNHRWGLGPIEVWVQALICCFASKTATLAPELIVSTGPRPHLSFCACKKTIISIRNTSLYGSQPAFAGFACKTAPLGTELHATLGPSPHLSFCACKRAWLAPELLVSMGPRLHLPFFACKTTWLASESLVSMGPSLHLWYSAFKTATLASQLLISMLPNPNLCFFLAKQRL